MEFAATLPVDCKLRNGQSKYLLKASMRGILPDRILDRDKQGFGVPIDRWFREDYREFVRDTLLSSRSLQRGYFRPERMQALIESQEAGACSYGSRVYALLMLELWHREYADGAGA
jgi:asparagine synthase (glutamine-hydrolysing)